jgi:hypothetical protein
MASTGKSSSTDAGMVARCFACNGPTRHPLPRYEHDGAVDTFHDTCVGSWLMSNPASVINFYTGPEAPRNTI